MKKIIIISILVILAFAGLVVFSNSSNQPDVSKKVITMSEKINTTDGQLIDVREPDEYSAGHADGAINIPLGNILESDFSNIQDDKPIYLICRSGRRAGEAKIALEKAGYKNVTNIGGTEEWEEQGDKVCSTSKPSC